MLAFAAAVGNDGSARRTLPGAGQSGDVAGLADGSPDARGLEAFISAVLKLAGAKAGAVRAVTPAGDGLRLLAAVGLPDAVIAAEEHVGACGVCGDAMRGDDVCVAAGPRACGRLASAGGLPSVAGSAVAVPLEYRGRSVGVFTLFFDGVNNLRPEVIHLLRPIGQLLGLTLENANLERERSEAALVRERQAMAGEIHDSIAQSLTFVRMQLPLLRDAIAVHDDERALRYCGDVGDELASANRRVRELITSFRAGFDAGGFDAAIAALAEAFRRRSGITLRVDPVPAQLGLSPERAREVLRIIQEAFANVQRHSGARSARLAIQASDEGLDITIEDDGCGIAPEVEWSEGPASHFGLKIMSERARAAGGRLSVIRIGAEGGTRVRLSIPRGAGVR